MEKKNKQILDDVQKYIKNESDQLKEKKKIKENKEDDSQKVEKTSFENIVRSEVKAWINKNAKRLSSLAIENAIKDINEKKSRSQIFKFGSFSLHESITDDIRVSIWLVI